MSSHFGNITGIVSRSPVSLTLGIDEDIIFPIFNKLCLRLLPLSRIVTSSTDVTIEAHHQSPSHQLVGIVQKQKYDNFIYFL